MSPPSHVLKKVCRDNSQIAFGLERVLTIILPALLDADDYMTLVISRANPGSSLCHGMLVFAGSLPVTGMPQTNGQDSGLTFLLTSLPAGYKLLRRECITWYGAS